MLLQGLAEFSPGSTIPKVVYLLAAQFLFQPILLMAPMESQTQSNMQSMVSDMEQELLSIYHSSTGGAMSGHQALLRLALYHLGEFSLSLTRLSGEAVSTKTEQ
jgi:hypothetical protein